MRFYSKIDWWFWAILVFVAAAFIPAVNEVASSGENEAIALLILAAVVSFGLPIWMVVSTFYEIVNKDLKIRSGPFRWRIPLKDISAVKPSRSLRSSPALSVDRLELTYSNSEKILLSPKNKEAFIAAIGQNV